MCVCACVCVCVHADVLQTWDENKLFADSEDATLFLGALDTIFLFAYAVVSAGLAVGGWLGGRGLGDGGWVTGEDFPLSHPQMSAPRTPRRSDPVYTCDKKTQNAYNVTLTRA